MTFLNQIDAAYDEARCSQQIQDNNKAFRIYLDLAPKDITSAIEFKCMKKDKAHILISSKGILTYLSDADIVYNLSNEAIIPKDLLSIFLEAFILLYQGNTSPFNFVLEGEDYSGLGLPYLTSELATKTFTIHSDLNISVNDFIFVLNMIFEKDRLTDSEFGGDHLKHTLCKYISLSQYYAFADPNAAKFLKCIRYRPGMPMRASLEKYEIGSRRQIFKKCDLTLFEKFCIV